MNEDEDEGLDLLGTMCSYDKMLRRTIRELRRQVQTLTDDNTKLREEALANAQANSRALLEGIVSGVISKPLDRAEKIKRLRKIFDEGMTCEGTCGDPLTDDELLAILENGT